MRIVLIILSLSALAFIVSILYMFANKDTQPLLSSKEHAPASNMNISSDTLALELLKNSYKQSEEINALKEKIEALETRNGIVTPTSNTHETPSESSTGKIIPISAKFLSRIMPTIDLSLTSNKGIFDLQIFEQNTIYSTYTDDRFGMTVIASMTSYENFLKNFQAIDKSIYSINPTNTFPFH